MRKTLFAATALAIALASTGWAQNRNDDEGLGVGDFAPDIEAEEWLGIESEDDIPSLAELRGMIVVVFFWTSWTEGGRVLLPTINMLQNQPGGGRALGFYAIGVTNASRQDTQPYAEKYKITFPIAVKSDAAKEYELDTGFGFVVIDITGRIAFKSDGSGDINGVVNAAMEELKERPPFKTHPDEARFCYRKLDEAVELIRKGDYIRARKAAEAVLMRAVLGDRIKSQAMEIIDLLDQLGYERLRKTEPLLENRKETEVADLLRKMLAEFKGLDCYKDAKTLWTSLKDENERFKDAAAGFEHEDEAARLLLAAREDLKERRFGESYDKLQKILTEYAKTESADYAQAMVNRMKQNREFWGHIEDYIAGPKCRELLSQGRNLAERRRYDAASKMFWKIIDDHPNTVWAEEAKQELKKLPA